MRYGVDNVDWAAAGRVVDEITTTDPEKAGLGEAETEYFVERTKGSLLIPIRPIYDAFNHISTSLHTASVKDVESPATWNRMTEGLHSCLRGYPFNNHHTSEVHYLTHFLLHAAHPCIARPSSWQQRRPLAASSASTSKVSSKHAQASSLSFHFPGFIRLLNDAFGARKGPGKGKKALREDLARRSRAQEPAETYDDDE